MTAWQLIAWVILGELFFMFLLWFFIPNDHYGSKKDEMAQAWMLTHAVIVAGFCIWGLIAIAIGEWVPW